MIAILLLMIANQTGLMREFKNRSLANVLGVFVILVASLIAVRQFYLVSAIVVVAIKWRAHRAGDI